MLSLEKRFIFFFGFMRLENDNQLFNGFRCPDDGGKVFHYYSLSNAVWNDEPANPFIRGNMPGKGAWSLPSTFFVPDEFLQQLTPICGIREICGSLEHLDQRGVS